MRQPSDGHLRGKVQLESNLNSLESPCILVIEVDMFRLYRSTWQDQSRPHRLTLVSIRSPSVNFQSGQDVQRTLSPASLSDLFSLQSLSIQSVHFFRINLIEAFRLVHSV